MVVFAHPDAAQVAAEQSMAMLIHKRYNLQQHLLRQRRYRKQRRVHFKPVVTIVEDDPCCFSIQEKNACFYDVSAESPERTEAQQLCSVPRFVRVSPTTSSSFLLFPPPPLCQQRQDRHAFEHDRAWVSLQYEKFLRNSNNNNNAASDNDEWDDDTEDTIRGLEDFFAQVPKEIARRRHARHVLCAQKNLIVDLHNDMIDATQEDIAHTIRYVSSELSAEARYRALRLGQADAQQVDEWR